MDILLNGVLVDELSTIVHVSRLEYNARRLTEKLKEMIPRQMVQVREQYDTDRDSQYYDSPFEVLNFYLSCRLQSKQ